MSKMTEFEFLDKVSYIKEGWIKYNLYREDELELELKQLCREFIGMEMPPINGLRKDEHYVYLSDIKHWFE